MGRDGDIHTDGDFKAVWFKDPTATFGRDRRLTKGPEALQDPAEHSFRLRQREFYDRTGIVVRTWDRVYEQLSSLIHKNASGLAIKS